MLKWPPSPATHDLAVYATLGASSNPLPGGDPQHRVEFVVTLDRVEDSVATSLCELAAHPALERVEVGYGHTLTLNEVLWPATLMRAFLVAGLTGTVEPLLLPDGLHIEFLRAIPVFDAEVKFRTKHGSEALARLWRERQVDITRTDRESAA